MAVVSAVEPMGRYLGLACLMLYPIISCEELTHWKRLWCWEGLGAGGEGDDRGWDGWMASQTRWTWVWVNSGSWWWTGRPGVLQFMGSQRVGHDWATELNYLSQCLSCTWYLWNDLSKLGPTDALCKGEMLTIACFMSDFLPRSGTVPERSPWSLNSPGRAPLLPKTTERSWYLQRFVHGALPGPPIHMEKVHSCVFRESPLHIFPFPFFFLRIWGKHSRPAWISG